MAAFFEKCIGNNNSLKNCILDACNSNWDSIESLKEHMNNLIEMPSWRYHPRIRQIPLDVVENSILILSSNINLDDFHPIIVEEQYELSAIVFIPSRYQRILINIICTDIAEIDENYEIIDLSHTFEE